MQPNEWPLLREVRLRALRDTPLAFGSTYTRESALADEQWAAWAVKRTTPGEQVTFLAFEQERCCGIIGCYIEPENPADACIVSMWVAPEARRQGVGARLIREAENWARWQGLRRLVLIVTENNEPAIRLYEHCGFRFTGESEPYPNDPTLRELFMMKPLDLLDAT
jgi:ribosomal protein S18 acetylase RimI-like enzyme